MLELEERRGSFGRTIFDAGVDVYIAWGGQAFERTALQAVRLISNWDEQPTYLSVAATSAEGYERDDGHDGLRF